VTSDQLDSDRTRQKEKTSPSTVMSRDRGLGSKVRCKLPSYPTRGCHSPFSYALYGGRVRFYKTTLTPTETGDSKPYHRLQSKYTNKQSPHTAEPRANGWCIVTGLLWWLVYHAEQTPKQQEPHHLHLSFLHQVKEEGITTHRTRPWGDLSF